jgi:uncharacterized protein (DUF2236 family)
VPAKHLPPPAAFQAYDIVAANGSPDRHRRGSLGLDGFSWFTEAGKRLVYSRDQRGDLVRPDLIAPNVCGDNLRGEFSIDRLGWLFVRHVILPSVSLEMSQSTYEANSLTRRGLSLHDGRDVVTGEALEQQLALVRAGAASPVAGVFGPASMMWQINREAVIFLAAGRALLLQLAHPWVAAAITEHSQALRNPIGRFHRTFQIVFTLVFGTVDQAFAAARRLHHRHSLITGLLPASVGPFAAGSPYSANNITALRWVYATLIDSALVAHDLVLGKTPPELLERYYDESKRFAGMFGIPSAALPRNYTGFCAYAEAMCNSDILTISPTARTIAEQIFAGTGTWFGVPMSYRTLTAALLPPRLRREAGFSYTDAERRGAGRSIELTRHIYRLLPARLRYVAPYQEAQQRLAGKLAIDTMTRLLNRLWMGQSSLAG